MPDIGDEAGQHALRHIADFAEWLLREAASKMPGIEGPSLRSRTADRTREIRENTPDELAMPDDPDARLDVDGVPCAVMCAADRDELDYIVGCLERENVEFSLTPDLSRPECDPASAEPGEDGLYRAYVPDREPAATIHAPGSRVDHVLVGSRAGRTLLSQASEDLAGLVERTSYARVTERLGAAAALAEGAGSVPEARLETGAPGNVTFAFETVGWDRDGRIVADWLADAGVPCASKRVGDGAVRFEIAPEHVEAARETVGSLVEHAHIEPSRFRGISPASLAGEDVVLRREVPDGAAAERIGALLDEARIRHSRTPLPSGGSEFAVSAADAAERGFALPRSKGEIGEALERIEASRRRTRAEAAPARVPLPKAAAERRPSEKPTPAKDERRARRVAREIAKSAPSRAIGRERRR